MKHANTKLILKNLGLDVMMLILFVLMFSFSVWLVWMYYFRGPVDIETRGYVSKTLKEVAVQPTETGKYTLQHFHNLDDTVLKGIEYPSTCVNCHGDYPHNKTPKVRAFFNAHAWFIACEVCHIETKQQSITYQWLDNDTDISLYKLQGERGIYGARIVPLLLENDKEIRLDNLISKDTLTAYQKSKDAFNEKEDLIAIDKIHHMLTDKPFFCDKCHAQNSAFDFNKLLYSENMSTHLQEIDVATMINGYKDFHFPQLYK